MNIREFRELGYLQEANRLFFHPHGLALEVTCTEERFTSVSFPDSHLRTLRALLDKERVERAEVEDDTDDLDAIESLLAEAKVYEPGDSYLSGVWDSDDPEGVVFGLGGYGDSKERAHRVAAERRKYFEARAALFADDPAIGADVEPLDWTYPDPTDDA